MIDARAFDVPSNEDEAIALFLSYATEGDRVTLHGDRYAARRDRRCNCVPITLTVGARS